MVALLDPPRVHPARPRRPAGPRGLPLLGVLPQFAADPLQFLTRTARRYGDLSYFKIGSSSMLLVTHPDDVEAVLVGAHRHCIKDRITRLLIHLFGEGLLTSEGETWRRQRKRAAPSFTRRHIAGYADAMVEHSERSCARLLAAGEAPDLTVEMSRLTLDIVLDTLFAVDPVRQREIGEALTVVMDDFTRVARGFQRVLPYWVPSPAKTRIDRAIAELHRILAEILDERRRGHAGDDLLSRMLAAHDASTETSTEAATEHGDPRDESQLRDEALTLLVAGHETTALTLTHALRQLDLAPELRERAVAELDRVLAGRRPSADDLPALPYLCAVVDEAMRLYPPAWAIGREATAAFELRGWPVLPGDNLFIAPWVLHRDPRWWPRPTRFVPERWLEPNERPRSAFLPFGGGPRICIGNHFARLAAVLVLATWLQRLDYSVTSPPLGLELQPSITLRPVQALPLRVAAR